MSIVNRGITISLLIGTVISSTVTAAPVTFTITTTETRPYSGDINTGTLVIDDSFLTPNTFIEAKNLTSFDFSIRGESFTKMDILRPEDDYVELGASGFLTDHSGTELVFDTTLPGPFFNLRNAAGFTLGFDSETNFFHFSDPNNTVLISGSWRLSQVPVDTAFTVILLGQVTSVNGVVEESSFFRVGDIIKYRMTYKETLADYSDVEGFKSSIISFSGSVGTYDFAGDNGDVFTRNDDNGIEDKPYDQISISHHDLDNNQTFYELNRTDFTFDDGSVGGRPLASVHIGANFDTSFMSSTNLDNSIFQTLANNSTYLESLDFSMNFDLVPVGIVDGHVSGKFSSIVIRPMHTTAAVSEYLVGAAETIFDWAEENYPQFFPMPGTASLFFDPWLYRYYVDTDAYVGVNTNGEVWVLGDVFGGLDYIGTVEDLLASIAQASPESTPPIGTFPNIVGIYRGSAAVSYTNCNDNQLNMTLNGRTFIDIYQQNENEFEGLAISVYEFDDELIDSLDSIYGTITNSGSISGRISRHYLEDARSEGTFGGAVNGDNIYLDFRFFSTVGETCTGTGSLSATFSASEQSQVAPQLSD